MLRNESKLACLKILYQTEPQIVAAVARNCSYVLILTLEARQFTFTFYL